MKPDGSDPVQITHLEGWEPGGAFIFRDNKPSSFEPGALPMPSPKTPPAHDALYDSGRRHAADAVDPDEAPTGLRSQPLTDTTTSS